MLVEAMGQALGYMAHYDFILFLTLGSVIGVVFGVIPGLTGLLAMALILPFAYQMEMHLALAFMLSAYASSCTGGSLTAILLGIPGTPANTASILDGYPMFKKGNGRKAISIAIWSSIFGGLLGCLYFALLIPVAYQAGFLFEAPEIFMTVVLSLVFLSMAGEGKTLVKGIIGGLIGMMLGFIGFQNITSEPRFTFGVPYLISGLSIVPLALGVFGIPELYELMVISVGKERGGKVSLSFDDLFYGLTAIIKNFKVFFISSILGSIVGIIPGVGGETSTFVCYSYAKSTSKNPEEFGEGAEMGLLAPETSNNAKEGGSLLPTLAFGIPGSAAMAILLGGLLVVGLQPGPHLLKENVDLAFLLTYALAFSNIIGGLLILFASAPVAALVTSPITVLAPSLGLAMSIGVYLVQTDVYDVFLMFIMGIVGYFLKKYGFSRSALLVAFVLTNTAELQLDIVTNAYGMEVFARPIFVILILLTLFIMFWSYYKARSSWLKKYKPYHGENRFMYLAMLVSIAYLVESLFFLEGTQLFPIVISLILLGLCLRMVVSNLIAIKKVGAYEHAETREMLHSKRFTLYELAGLAFGIWLFGLGPGGFIFSVYYNRRKRSTLLLTFSVAIIIGLLGYYLPVVIGYLPYKGVIYNILT